MTVETKTLVNEIIKNDLNKIKHMELGSDDRYNAIKDLDTLMKMVTDSEKTDIEREKIEVDREKLELEERRMDSEKEISYSKIEMEQKKLDSEKEMSDSKLQMDQKRLDLEEENLKLEKDKIENEATAAKKRQKGELVKVITENGSRLAVAGLGFAGTCLAIYADRNGWFVSKMGLSQNPKLSIK